MFEADLNIFINDMELSEPHNIDGSEISCVIDEDQLLQRSDTTDVGVSEIDITVFAKTADLQAVGIESKEYGEHIRIDHDTLTVIKWTDTLGITRMELSKGVM